MIGCFSDGAQRTSALTKVIILSDVIEIQGGTGARAQDTRLQAVYLFYCYSSPEDIYLFRERKREKKGERVQYERETSIGSPTHTTDWEWGSDRQHRCVRNQESNTPPFSKLDHCLARAAGSILCRAGPGTKLAGPSREGKPWVPGECDLSKFTQTPSCRRLSQIQGNYKSVLWEHSLF